MSIQMSGLLLALVFLAMMAAGCAGDPAEGMKINQTAAGCAVARERCYS
jgi:hypothetical protein